MSRHCRHCRPRCHGDGTVMFGTPRKHYDVNYSAWSGGNCPACAEAERIAEAVEVEVSDAYSPAPDHYGRGYLDALTLAARIARGETR